MQAIILSAGKGTRMGKLTEDSPKSLLCVENQPLILHTLNSLPKNIKEIIIVIKYKGECIKERIGDYHNNLPVTYVIQNDMTGTAGAVWSTKEYIKGKFLVLNGDDLYSKEELEDLVSYDFAIGLVYRKPLNKNYSCVDINKDNGIIGWSYPKDDDPAFLVNGAYLLDKRIFDYKPQVISNGEYSLPHTLFNISKNIYIRGVVMKYWHSFNKPDDFKIFEQHKEIDSVLKDYGITEFEIVSIPKTGLINHTYEIKSKTGHFILQKLNPIYDTEVLLDFHFVSDFVNKADKIISSLISTKNGGFWVKKGNNIWRMFEFIKGNVFETVDSSMVAYEAGKILGNFHMILRSCQYQFKSNVPIPHQSGAIFDRFVKTINSQDEKNPDIKYLIEKIKEIEKFFLPEWVTESIVHGDPKISNIIFSEEGKAVALIDLDGCNRNKILLEIGDALRSWCGALEDDPFNRFCQNKYKEALRGYMSTSTLISKEELELIPKAIKLVTLELASKFLRDYYIDSYFGWDNKRYKSRKEHNLARAKSQVALFEDLQKVFPEKY